MGVVSRRAMGPSVAAMRCLFRSGTRGTGHRGAHGFRKNSKQIEHLLIARRKRGRRDGRGER